MNQLREEIEYHNHKVRTWQNGSKRWWEVDGVDRECGTLAEAVHIAKAKSACAQLADYGLLVKFDLQAVPEKPAVPQEDTPQEEPLSDEE